MKSVVQTGWRKPTHPPGQTSSTKLYNVRLVKNEHGDKVAATVIGYVKVGAPIKSVGHWKCVAKRLTNDGATTQQKRPWRERGRHFASACGTVECLWPLKKEQTHKQNKILFVFSWSCQLFPSWEKCCSHAFLYFLKDENQKVPTVSSLVGFGSVCIQWLTALMSTVLLPLPPPFPCLPALYKPCSPHITVRLPDVTALRPSVRSLFPRTVFLLAYVVWRCEDVKVRPLRIQDLKCRSNQCILPLMLFSSQ